MSRSLFDNPTTAGAPGSGPPPHPLRQKIKDGAVALSLANLFFVTPWYYQLRDQGFGYYNSVPLTPPMVLATLTNLFWFTVLGWLVIRTGRRCQNKWFRATCEWLLLMIWLPPLDFCRASWSGLTEHDIQRFLTRPAGVAGALLLLAIVAWKRRWIARAAFLLAGILSPLALFTLARLAFVPFGLHYSQEDISGPPPPPLRPVRQDQPRVIWLIFDETDQRLAFEQRPADLRLPAFDRLRSDSIYATNAYPPGANTTRSVPGLFTGYRISTAHLQGASDLMLTFADTDKVAAWSELPSVFTSARELGFNTALVGWFHPYSRILGRSLNHCYWYPYPQYEPTRAPDFRTGLCREIACLAGGVHYRQRTINQCRAALADSLSLVTNATYGLVFLHLQPPHFPGIFKADTGHFTILGMSKVAGYFGNLALADRSLDRLRRAMETSGQWDKSWLILSADHHWRQSDVYDGKLDLRVPFLIKAPGAAQSITCSTPINTCLSHDLVLAILRGELTNQAQAAAWLEAHPCADPAAGLPPGLPISDD